jgi:hypothetical protein
VKGSLSVLLLLCESGERKEGVGGEWRIDITTSQHDGTGLTGDASDGFTTDFE